MTKHVFREELSEDQARERVIQALCDMPIGAYLICKKAELPIRTEAGGYILDLDPCFCPEKHTVSTESDHPDLERMRIRGDHVWCVIHERKFGVRQLLDLLPLKTRKTTAKRDELLATINIHPAPTRYYCLQSGRDFETTGMSTDPREAEAQVALSPKVQSRGTLIECVDVHRARQILETMTDSLPWKDLAGDIRSDLQLVANWHKCQLTEREKLTLHTQELETAVTKRKARMRLVEQMRRDADLLVVKPL